MESQSPINNDIEQLRKLIDRQVTPLIRWYQRKKRWPRRLHKATTAAVIILGALIPIASAWSQSTTARIIVGGLGVTITVITSLAASYEWHKNWRLFTIAQSALESQLANWELALTKAQLLPAEEGRQEAIDATTVLLMAANQARDDETRAFFEGQGDRPGMQILQTE